MFFFSLWGKFAQRPNLGTTEIIGCYDDFMKIMNNSDLTITSEIDIDDETWMVNYEHKDMETAPIGQTSVAIAAFVTSYARIVLHRKMMEIERSAKHTDGMSVLYTDTDSIVYVVRGDDTPQPTGSKLGEWTDEIRDSKHPNAYCREAIFYGPKSYALEIDQGDDTLKHIIKVKGITLKDARAKSTVTMERLRRGVKRRQEGEPDEVIRVPQKIFRASRNHQTYYCEDFEKRLQITEGKRVTIDNLPYTVPYGFKPQ